MLYFQNEGTAWKIEYKEVLVNFCVLLSVLFRCKTYFQLGSTSIIW